MLHLHRNIVLRKTHIGIAFWLVSIAIGSGADVSTVLGDEKTDSRSKALLETQREQRGFLVGISSAARGGRRPRLIQRYNYAQKQIAVLIDNGVTMRGTRELLTLKSWLRELVGELDSTFRVSVSFTRDLGGERKTSMESYVTSEMVKCGTDDARDRLDEILDELETDSSEGERFVTEGITSTIKNHRWQMPDPETDRMLIVCVNDTSDFDARSAEARRRARDRVISMAKRGKVRISTLQLPSSSRDLAAQARTRQVMAALSRETGGDRVDMTDISNIEYWSSSRAILGQVKDQEVANSVRPAAIKVRLKSNASDIRDIFYDKIKRSSIELVSGDDQQLADYTFDIDQTSFRGRVTLDATLLRGNDRVAQLKQSEHAATKLKVRAFQIRFLKRFFAEIVVSRSKDDATSKLCDMLIQDCGATAKLDLVVAANRQARTEIEMAIGLMSDSHALSGRELHLQSLRALGHLRYALSVDAKNAFARLLEARIFFNLAQDSLGRGDRQLYDRFYERYEYLIFQANSEKEAGAQSLFSQEIAAEYALMKGNFQEATEILERISKHKDAHVARTALRAHWTLAGIYAGDWIDGVASDDRASKPPIDRSAVAFHLQKILEAWPDSAEAEFIRSRMPAKTDNAFGLSWAPSQLLYRKPAPWMTRTVAASL